MVKTSQDDIIMDKQLHFDCLIDYQSNLWLKKQLFCWALVVFVVDKHSQDEAYLWFASMESALISGEQMTKNNNIKPKKLNKNGKPASRR